MADRFDPNDVLMCDPFEGDFGGDGAGDRILSDRVVTARKSHTCHLCLGPVEPGTRSRARVEVYEARAQTGGSDAD